MRVTTLDTLITTGPLRNDIFDWWVVTVGKPDENHDITQDFHETVLSKHYHIIYIIIGIIVGDHNFAVFR